VWLYAERNGAFGALVRFILLTAARLGEAADLPWTEITNGDWTLPASRNKTKVELVRPLSRTALAILEERRNAGAPPTSEWVFSISGRISIRSSAHYFKELFDKSADVSGYMLHDLRRSSRSLMSRAGVAPDVAERCLGHAIPGIRATYDRHSYRE